MASLTEGAREEHVRAKEMAEEAEERKADKPADPDALPPGYDEAVEPNVPFPEI